jgi:glycosyltransferase involved in cell wall biosynthesis
MMSNPDRIHFAFFLPALMGGGAERVFLNLCHGMLASGHRVDLVMTRATGALLSEVPPDVKIVDLACSRTVYSLISLVRYLRTRRPDVLISSLNTCNIIAALAGKLAGGKTRVYIRQANTLSMTLAAMSAWSRRLFFLMIRYSYPCADGIIVVSQNAAEDLRQLMGFPENKVKVIYNPVVIPSPAKTENPKEMDWFLPGCPPVILGVGKLESQKDFPTLIRAFNEVRKERQAHLLILGEGSQRNALEELVEELDLTHLVRLPGFVHDPYAYMRRANVFVLSSAWEGLPNVLLEAIACGCPVVSTDCPSGPKEILEEGKWGEMVPVGDVDGMAAKICSILGGNFDSSLLVTRSHDFSLKRICSEYIEACR